MGGCAPKKKSKQIACQTIPLDLLCRYPRQACVTIKFKNYIGRITSEQNINFSVTEPTQIKSDTFYINTLKVHLSLSILPGMDIKQKLQYSCQDLTFYLSDGHSILLVLMDGHGKEGDKVVSFCSTLIESLYTTQKDLQRVTPYSV